MDPVVINNWSTTSLGDPFMAPEIRPLAVQGVTENDHRRPGKTSIRTSAVVDVSGRTFTTNSGTVYRLGRIDPKFRAWLRKEGREYDPKRPIKVVTRIARGGAAGRK